MMVEYGGDGWIEFDRKEAYIPYVLSRSNQSVGFACGRRGIRLILNK